MATEAPISMFMPQLHQPRSRPTSLLLSPNPTYAPTSPRGGILLNARSPLSATSGYSSGFNTPRSVSPSPAALHPDSARMDRSSMYSSTGSRKIRFAPLPEPRREVIVDEEGAEIPCAATYPADATAFPVQSPGAGPSVTLDRTDSLVTDSGASTNSTDETQSQKSAKRSKRNSLLRLVGLGSSNSGLSKRPSTASLPTSDSGLFSSMFRTTSRESWSGEPSGYTSDNSVARRMSSPLRPSSAGGRPSSGYASFGAPLAHATSDGTGTRPQRMLNGRVYGARRARERLQPLPSMEPEFSEWGYGGMGSVNNGSEYSKLQSKTSSVGGLGGNDEEDDGSGLSWARKRKEKREREAREKREAEEAAAKAAAPAQPEESTNPSRPSTETTGSSTTVHAERSETPTAPHTPTGTATAMSPPRPRTVSSPPSRQNSTATVTPDRHHPTVVAVPAHRGRQEASALNNNVVTSPETSPERSSGSSRRSSSSDDEDAEDSTGREDEEEEEEENQKRKTALSAGVEKISRHH
ncbi:unnamed protein product [Rhizoctonia solani]|uniref:Uncharacterized protein n=1 Tax=Rhizoctonia solani TaxID=456999 RepID=A0A8H2Y0P9_9AGAM|nr:unnamed protein product [Rhizoctonia solani]